jgi:hypothetical protein
VHSSKENNFNKVMAQIIPFVPTNKQLTHKHITPKSNKHENSRLIFSFNISHNVKTHSLPHSALTYHPHAPRLTIAHATANRARTPLLITPNSTAFSSSEISSVEHNRLHQQVVIHATVHVRTAHAESRRKSSFPI